MKPSTIACATLSLALLVAAFNASRIAAQETSGSDGMVQADPGSFNASTSYLSDDNRSAFANRWFASGDYLIWWMKGTPTPPLVTTSSRIDTNTIGAVGQSATEILYGGTHAGLAVHSGGRLDLGYWFADDHSLGIDIAGFGLNSAGKDFYVSSGGSPVLARPFADTGGNASALIVAGPQYSTGVLDSGSIQVRYRGNWWGGEANLRSQVRGGRVLTLELLAGFRTLGLDESLEIDGQSSPTQAIYAGTVRDIRDQFKTSNRFYGANLGALAKIRMGRWFVDLSGKVALGATQTLVDIDGSVTASIYTNGVLDTSESGVTAGGLYTSTTNMGRHASTQFSFIPEAGINLGYQITPLCRAYVGYTFLYWSGVGRPGSQIDTTVSGGTGRLVRSNPSGDLSRPHFLFSKSDIWAQGVNFGLQLGF